LLWSGHQADRSRAEKWVPQRSDGGPWRRRALHTAVTEPEQQEPTLAAEPETYRGAFSGGVGRGIDELGSAPPEPRRAETR
jgi:hypothetical protein